MKIKLAVIAILLSMVLVASAYAAGSLTELREILGAKIRKVTLTWTGDATDGTVPATVISPLNGYVLKVVTKPHVNSTIQPQDNYDVYLYEHTNGSIDLFNGKGADRDTANNEYFYPSHYNGTTEIYPVYSEGPVKLVHSNSSVASATGQVIIYVEIPK